MNRKSVCASFASLAALLFLTAPAATQSSIVDKDHDGLDDNLEAQLIENNAPILHFADGEVDMPITFNDFLLNAELQIGLSSVVAARPLTPARVLSAATPTSGDFVVYRRLPGRAPDDASHKLNLSLNGGPGLRGLDRSIIVTRKNVGLYGHVAPLRYTAVDPDHDDAPVATRNVIVVQYFLLFGNNDNHGEKYTDACPKVGVLVGALALGPCGEACRITGPGFPICFAACVAGAGVAAGVVCDKKLKPILNSFNHEGDWNLYEVFLNEATLTPVVQIWYHHGMNHTKALRGYLPENSIRNHRGRRPLKINCGDVQEFCDPINSILEDLQNKYLNGTFDTFEVVDGNLQGHADAYVGLQGHELWPRNGEDNWSNLWHFFGIETTYNGAPLQTGTTGGGLAIPNIGEIPYPFPVTEPNYGPSDFLCRYNGVWGGSGESPESIMNNSGIKFQWPNYRSLHVDSSQAWYSIDADMLSLYGVGPYPPNGLATDDLGSFGDPFVTLNDALQRILRLNSLPATTGSRIDPFIQVTLQGGNYPETNSLPITITQKVVLRSLGSATVGKRP